MSDLYFGKRKINEGEIEIINQEKLETERLKEEKDYFQKGFISMHDRINKAIEYISKEFLCYDNESDEYIQGLKTIEILKGDKDE